jgi:hypothetical protein
MAFVIQTTKNILPGEEILVSYGAEYFDTGHMCHCETCRTLGGVGLVSGSVDLQVDKAQSSDFISDPRLGQSRSRHGQDYRRMRKLKKKMARNI